MFVSSSSSRQSRLLSVLGFVVVAGLLSSGWYLYDSGVFIGFTRGGSYLPNYGKPASTFGRPSATTAAFPFPRKIWQTGPSLEQNAEVRPLVRSWYRQNSDFRYELLNDIGAEEYVKFHFSNQTKYLNAYMDMPDAILRADLLRLLVMFASGGVYSDLDTKCLMPIDDWIPTQYQKMARVVVGIEVDLSQDDVPEDRKSKLQICQWTLMARPGNKHFKNIIDYVLNQIDLKVAEKNVPLAELGHNMAVPEVIHTTGPGAFTKAIFESLSNSLGAPVDHRNLSGLQEPLLLDDILFLPINAFAGNQEHSHSGEADRGPLFVKHLFRSSWWDGKGGKR